MAVLPLSKWGIFSWWTPRASRWSLGSCAPSQLEPAFTQRTCFGVQAAPFLNARQAAESTSASNPCCLADLETRMAGQPESRPLRPCGVTSGCPRSIPWLISPCCLLQGSTGCAQMQWRHQPGGYLKEILTARVYDVAVRFGRAVDRSDGLSHVARLAATRVRCSEESHILRETCCQAELAWSRSASEMSQQLRPSAWKCVT